MSQRQMLAQRKATWLEAGFTGQLPWAGILRLVEKRQAKTLFYSNYLRVIIENLINLPALANIP